jgi:hypothetical protein
MLAVTAESSGGVSALMLTSESVKLWLRSVPAVRLCSAPAASTYFFAHTRDASDTSSSVSSTKSGSNT